LDSAPKNGSVHLQLPRELQGGSPKLLKGLANLRGDLRAQDLLHVLEMKIRVSGEDLQ